LSWHILPALLSYAAEPCGLSTKGNVFSVTDDLWYVPGPDPAVLLGALAAHTSRVRIGTAVLLAAPRPPVLVAKMAATLDHLAEGRFAICRALWESGGKPVRYDGRFSHLRDVRFDLPPHTPGGPPVWGAGHVAGAHRRIRCRGRAPLQPRRRRRRRAGADRPLRRRNETSAEYRVLSAE
jgi:alkanesulfonate monooxygenase SsuD/methylene tetrahydromethanopterin reductase-like flavin-dependent oxidoreductase (luciferase family)